MKRIYVIIIVLSVIILGAAANSTANASTSVNTSNQAVIYAPGTNDSGSSDVDISKLKDVSLKESSFLGRLWYNTVNRILGFFIPPPIPAIPRGN
jgi:hypothetical protein